MSIESEINRIRANVDDTLNAIGEMGGTVPENATSNDMAAAARSIPQGGGLPVGGKNQMLVTDQNGNMVWQGRTHWKEEGYTEILPEITVSGEEELYILEPFKSDLVVGETYTVKYNGTEYRCVGRELPIEGVTTVCLGNLGAILGDETLMTEDPFIIVWFPKFFADSMGGLYGVVYDLEGAASATVSVNGMAEVYHPIERKYLPEYMYGKEYSLQQTYCEEELSAAVTSETVAYLMQPFLKPLTVNGEYTVALDGVSYKCASAYAGSDYGGCVVASVKGVCDVVYFDTPQGGTDANIYGVIKFAENISVPSVVSVTGCDVTIYRVDEKYLPASKNSNIVNGQEEGSLCSTSSSKITAINSIALGYRATAGGERSVALGAYAQSSGGESISLGGTAHGSRSVAIQGTATGTASLALGVNCEATAAYSTAIGVGVVAGGMNSAVLGYYNTPDDAAQNRYVLIVGNGAPGSRSNAHTLDWSGNGWFAGNLYVGGTNQDKGKKVATIEDIQSYVDDAILGGAW